MRIAFRRFTDADSAIDLTALLHAAYAQLGAWGFNYTAVDQTIEITRSRLAGGECYIAEEGGQLVGTILFRDAAQSSGCPWYDRPEVSTFGQFGVLPAFQNRGVGAQLLALVEARAIASGAAELALDTAEGAADLIEWYRRRGFREVGHTQWEGKTYRSVLMSKRLGHTAAR